MSITPESVQILLNSADFSEKIRGINQLQAIPPDTALSLLKPLLTDENVRIRYAAVSQLDTIGVVDKEQALCLLRDRIYNEPEIDVQAAAADAIGGLKLIEAYPDLEKLYRETSEWLLQFSIIAALGELGDPRAFDLLSEAIASEIEIVKTAAISALGELGDPRAIALLTPFAESEDWQLRHRVAQAFGNLKGDEVRAILEKLATDEFEQVATEAKYHLNSN